MPFINVVHSYLIKPITISRYLTTVSCLCGTAPIGLFPKDILAFQPEFQKYPLNDFKRYNSNRNMKILVSKKVKLAAIENAIDLEDMQRHPHKKITCRGTPLWSKYAAKKMQ
jgi:hypothetical protein